MCDIENKILSVINLESSFDDNFLDFNFDTLNEVAFVDGKFTFIDESCSLITKYLENEVDAEKFIDFLRLLSKVFEQLIKNKNNLANSYNYCVDVYNLSLDLYEKSKDKGLPNKNYLVKLKRFIQDLNEPVYKLNISKDRKLDYLLDCFNNEIVLMNAKEELNVETLSNFKHLLNIYIKENDPLALYIYGVCLSELDKCFKTNYPLALKCFLLSSRSGNYKSFVKAGDIYYNGHLDKEKTFYKKAYESYVDSLLIEENEQARFRLSDMYLYGHSVNEDKNIAFKLISTSMRNVHDFYQDMNFLSCYPEVAYRYAKLLYELRNYEDHTSILCLLRAYFALTQRRLFSKYREDLDLLDDIKKELAHFSKTKISDTIEIFEQNNFSKKVKLVPDQYYLIKHNDKLHFIAKYLREEKLQVKDITSYTNHVFEIIEVTSCNGNKFEPKAGDLYNMRFVNCPQEITKYKPHILTKEEDGFIAIDSENDLEEYVTNPNLVTNTSELSLVCTYDLNKQKDEIVLSFKNDDEKHVIKFVKCLNISFPFKPLDKAKIVSIETEVLKEIGNIFSTKIEYIDEDENSDTLEISSACILVKK